MIYLNPKQLRFFRSVKPYKMFLGGRGSGKTTTESAEQYRAMQMMPRSRGFIASSTYGQLLTSTLPSVERLWAKMGLEEGDDYVIGVKPPEYFDKSFMEPRKYDNVISFRNGRRINMLSMDRPDLQRGGSYTDGAVDEAALVPHEHLTKVLIASIRGWDEWFGKVPINGMLRMYTSIPWRPLGYWTLEYEEKAKQSPKMYEFIEANAYDNVRVLGEDYIQRLEAEMPYLEFMVEVMNMRIRKIPDAYYHAFSIDKHTYTGRYIYVDGARGIETQGVADPNYKDDEALDVSFDFSGYFNCASVWQSRKQRSGTATLTTEYCLRQFYVKTEQGKVGQLVDDIAKQYQGHKTKAVRLWGEPRGHDPRPDNPKTLFQQIADRFQLNGWAVEIRVKPSQVKHHKERCFYMNEVFEETNPHLPIVRFNDLTCKDLIISLQVTAIKDDYQKDKRIEKNRTAPQEHAPHFSDTVDYYIMQKYQGLGRKFRPSLTASVR